MTSSVGMTGVLGTTTRKMLIDKIAMIVVSLFSLSWGIWAITGFSILCFGTCTMPVWPFVLNVIVGASVLWTGYYTWWPLLQRWPTVNKLNFIALTIVLVFGLRAVKDVGNWFQFLTIRIANAVPAGAIIMGIIMLAAFAWFTYQFVVPVLRR
ncbi:hypothetical protein GF342_02950 [Candidatus Woesearchaeota archaeon]|nr:hypothetical protein [Candidatus Woesearchaeota archaeon]